MILTDIYAAREKDPGTVHSKDIVELMKPYDVDARYISSFEDIKEFLLEHVKENDLVITMGAGNVVEIGEDLVK